MQAVNFAPAPLPESMSPIAWATEQPLIVALALAAAGIACWVLLSRREQAKLGTMIGGALMFMAVAVFALGTLIETDRERLERRTREFVAAAVDADIPALEDLILPDAVLAASGRTIADDARGQIESLSQAQQAAGVIESWRVSKVQAVQGGSNVGTTQFRARVTPRAGGVTLSWWKLHWRRDAEGAWRCSSIDCLAINGREPGGGVFDRLLDAARGGRSRGF
ncbi:MAG: DUF4440 domain-containing protein [Phycisphaeraceae bacterium]|nr:DUF4440 domain-containing protein [Phycisphaeraceae bacterium]